MSPPSDGNTHTRIESSVAQSQEIYIHLLPGSLFLVLTKLLADIPTELGKYLSFYLITTDQYNLPPLYQIR